MGGSGSMAVWQWIDGSVAGEKMEKIGRVLMELWVVWVFVAVAGGSGRWQCQWQVAVDGGGSGWVAVGKK
jgi:hypothetical protein